MNKIRTEKGRTRGLPPGTKIFTRNIGTSNMLGINRNLGVDGCPSKEKSISALLMNATYIVFPQGDL